MKCDMPVAVRTNPSILQPDPDKMRHACRLISLRVLVCSPIQIKCDMLVARSLKCAYTDGTCDIHVAGPTHGTILFCEKNVMILNRGQTLICPHCEEAQDSTVEDFVISGRTGADSTCEEQCGDCDKFFEVTCLGKDQYEVIPIEE